MFAEFDSAELVAAMDDVAGLLLAQANLDAPPVNAQELARRLNITVVSNRDQPGRARLKRIDGRPCIILRPEPRLERFHWAIAHEVAEHAAHRVFRLAGVPADEVSPQSREEVNQLAARLLMPTVPFAADAARWAYDLIELKRRYATASHESIAWRLLALPAALIVTVFDHGEATARRSNLPGRRPPLHPVERNCWESVHRLGRPERIEWGALSAAGFPIHEDGWKREILLTRLDSELDDGAWA